MASKCLEAGTPVSCYHPHGFNPLGLLPLINFSYQAMRRTEVKR